MSDAAPHGYTSIPDAVVQLGISRQRVYQLVRMGILPSERRGNRVWVPQAAIDARLAAEGRLNSNQCVSTREVADFFGVDLSTVHEWRRQGLLNPSKVNNTLCFDINEVIKLVPPRARTGTGRTPGKRPTRTLRGRYFPEPPDERNTHGESGT